MAENNNLPPTSGKLSDKLKTMATQGLLGAISLTAAAVIPIVIQRFFSPPVPVTPASSVPGMAPTEVQSPTNGEAQLDNEPEEKQRGRHRNKPEREDDD